VNEAAAAQSNEAINKRDSLFWDIAQPLLATGAEESTMMGFPCLRINGEFFASVERETGDLIVKLPAERVTQMVDDGEAVEFAPAGRRFKEWARISDREELLWVELMSSAIEFVEGSQT
jgi:hypothetical protein